MTITGTFKREPTQCTRFYDGFWGSFQGVL